MRHILFVCLVALVAGIGVSVATAAQDQAGLAWKESKAERILKRDATVRLSSDERASLEEELRKALMLFRGLELGALDEGNESAWRVYRSAGNRYQQALQSVRGGLRIDDADCSGSGRAIGGDRFKQFHCLVTSEVLRIPSAELDTSNGGMPAVVEGQPREVGPYFTQIRVHITGKSTVMYR